MDFLQKNVFKRILFIVVLNYVHGFNSVCAHACGTPRGQKGASENLESELKVVVSDQMCVLGMECKPSARAVCS